MRRNRIAIGVVVAVVVAVMAWAWIDGGREPLRRITQPVPLPEAAR